MKDITQYINEGLVDALMKVFVGKLKMLQKKFNISENSIDELSKTLAENQDNLNNELSNLAKSTSSAHVSMYIPWSFAISLKMPIISSTCPGTGGMIPKGAMLRCVFL